MTKSAARARQSAKELGDVPNQLAALEAMSIGALVKRYRELYGEPTRSKNGEYLRKRLAWRIQELAEGGLPASALARIAELGDRMPERWRIRQAPPPGETNKAPIPPVLEPRDPRVPPVGTVLRRVFAGKAHEVAVCAEGFEYDGERYRTLSAVAKHITGTPWNGFLFFRLRERVATAREGTKAGLVLEATLEEPR